MTPLTLYHNQCQQGLLTSDSFQETILQQFDHLHSALALESEKRRGWFAGWRQRSPVKGIYLWGRVGVGKTFMMDTFYQCLPLLC